MLHKKSLPRESISLVVMKTTTSNRQTTNLLSETVNGKKPSVLQTSGKNTLI